MEKNYKPILEKGMRFKNGNIEGVIKEFAGYIVDDKGIRHNISDCLTSGLIDASSFKMTKKDEVREMLDTCLSHVTGNGIEYIESLDLQYIERGFLTEKQIQALEKFHDNL